VKIFLSYTSADRDWAMWIGVTLRDAGHEMAVYEWGIGAGEKNGLRWMERRLGAADRMIGVFSPAYIAAIHSNSERWAAYWLDPVGSNGFLVPIEVAKIDRWPPFSGTFRRLSLVGRNEVEAKSALVALLGKPTTQPALTASTFFSFGDRTLPTATAFPLDGALKRREPKMVPGVSSGDEQSLGIWLRMRPGAVVLAARTALRAAPLLSGLIRLGEQDRRSRRILLLLLRGIAASLAAARSLASAEGIGVHAASVGAAAAARGVRADNAAAQSAVRAAAKGARDAVVRNAAFAAAAAFAADIAAFAAGAASAVCAKNSFVAFDSTAVATSTDENTLAAIISDFKAAVAVDAAEIDAGVPTGSIVDKPLWLVAAPESISQLLQYWHDLKNLLPVDENWSVWTAWYEDLVQGSPANQEREFVRLTLPEELWKDPAKANAEIQRRFDDIDARPVVVALADAPPISAPSPREQRAESGHDVATVIGSVPPLVFVSYAHKDRAWLDELNSHLGPHLHQGSLRTWDDTRLGAGDVWEAEIAGAMHGCRVCVLLVSRYSLTSDYIDRVEMRTILERVRNDGIRIFPVIVSPVSIPAGHWLRAFNWRPTDGRSLMQFPTENGARDAEFVKIVDEIIESLGQEKIAAAMKVVPAPAFPQMPPPAPPPQAGTSFDVGRFGLEREPGPRPGSGQPIVLRRHDALRRSAGDLAEATARLENRFPDLVHVVASYAAAIARKFAELDLFEIHDLGLSLVSLANTFRISLELGLDVPDPEQVAELGALAARHVGFAHGIDEMREYSGGAETDRRSPADLKTILAPMLRLIDALAKLREGLAPGTKSHLEAIAGGLGEVVLEDPEGVRIVYVTLSNALLAIALHFEDVHAAETEGGVAASRLNTRPEDTRALLRFLADHRADVEAFAAPFAKLSALLAWVYRQMVT
jgi:hypothetical protein